MSTSAWPVRRLLKSALTPVAAVALAGTVLLAGCSGGGDNAGAPLASDAALASAVAKLHDALQRELGQPVPSLSVLIETPKGAFFATATGAGATPVTPDTNFRFASNTKNFTATSVMKMHQDGWLRYTDLITATIPGSSVPYVPDTAAWALPNKAQITIRHLLQHSAGVYDVGNDPVPGCADLYEECVRARDPAHSFTSEELVSQAARHQLSYFPPGQGFHYSNTGYSTLAEIVARTYSQRSGQPRSWADYVRDHLTADVNGQPLKVHFPDRGSDQVLPEPRACGRILLPDAAPLVTCDVNISAKVAEGNGIGTMRQLSTWVRTVQSGRHGLSAQTLALMRDDGAAANPAFGLGTMRFENLGFGHTGATLGNLSLMAYDPAQQVSVVVYLPLWDLRDGLTSFQKTYDHAELRRLAGPRGAGLCRQASLGPLRGRLSHATPSSRRSRRRGPDGRRAVRCAGGLQR